MNDMNDFVASVWPGQAPTRPMRRTRPAAARKSVSDLDQPGNVSSQAGRDAVFFADGYA
jgi:hypothetical protein